MFDLSQYVFGRLKGLVKYLVKVAFESGTVSVVCEAYCFHLYVRYFVGIHIGIRGSYNISVF